jgi:hypothetical protein
MYGSWPTSVIAARASASATLAESQARRSVGGVLGMESCNRVVGTVSPHADVGPVTET